MLLNYLSLLIELLLVALLSKIPLLICTYLEKLSNVLTILPSSFCLLRGLKIMPVMTDSGAQGQLPDKGHAEDKATS